MEWGWPLIIQLLIFQHLGVAEGNEPPVFLEDLSQEVLSESTSVGTVVGWLKGSDPEGSPVRYGISGTDRLQVDPDTGQVTLVKPLDHEVNDTLQFYITLEDDVNNLVRIPITVIIIDENDNPPLFKNTPYESVVPEDTPVGSTVFKNILVEDPDLSGEILEVFCEDLPQFPDACKKFEVVVRDAGQQKFEGNVVLRNKLNYAEAQFYQLLLVATDGSHNSTTGFEIKVGDVQDTPPMFQGSLTGIIQEDDPIGSLVMTVHAKDGDRGVPRKIVYDLLTNPLDYFLLDSETGELRIAKPLNREALTESTGVISLKIRAREVVDGLPSSDPLTSTSADALITIKDVNDEPPQFNQREYSVKLLENLPIGTPLPNLNMTVSDPDIGLNSKFALRLSDVSNSFAVEPAFATGSTAVSIRLVNGPLDYENPNHRKFIILVIAKETETNPKLGSTATVTVEVLDANDNPPKFERDAYSAQVEEGAFPGDVVTVITANDADTGVYGPAGLVYQLNGHGEEKFSVNRKTGQITVAPCDLPGSPHCLDFETKPIYYLNYQVTDYEGKGQSTVVPLKITLLDSNDNPPVFTSDVYKAIIDEGSATFEPSLFVQAKDVDKSSEITYRILGGNVNNLFSVDSHSGEISVTSPQGVDTTNITHDHILLLIQASDGEFTANCTVDITVLDVNNNNPVFESEQYSAQVMEDAHIGTSIAKVLAHDADTGINAELVYRVEKGAFDDFGVDNQTGDVRITSKLDYDRRNSYTVLVIAVDGGTPTLTGTTTLSINVINSNDKIPYFSPTVQRAEVKEDARVGEVVHRLIAMDPDIESPDALNFAASEPITGVDKNGKEVTSSSIFKDFFNVDRTTGVVTVARPLDREVASVVRITVLVTDITAPNNQQGNGSLMITIVDVNDFAPVFLKPWTVADPRYSVDLLEEQPEGTIVGTFTAIDQDSNLISYAIEPPSDYFSVNTSTGVVETKLRIDYERTPRLNFKLVAYDSGVPQLSSTADITVNIININDMDPIFDQVEYQFQMEENAAAGTIVGSVHASDSDSGAAGKITYSLSQEGSNFVVDPETGEIRVAEGANLDREKSEMLLFRVIAQDNAPAEEPRTAAAQVVIKLTDINDNAPVFTQHLYTVNIVESISLNPPAPILQLRAQDSDVTSQLRYAIVAGNNDNVFTVDAVSGIMYPQVSLRHKLPHYSLQVKVSDGIFTDKASVGITVQAINENQPVFIQPSLRNSSVHVKENDAVGNVLVLTVVATDGDTGENGRITYHLKVNDKNVQETEDFIINEETGELRAKMPLDREKKSHYQLVLAVRDHGSPTWYESLRFLSIVLDDDDDNKPQFPNMSEPYTFHILENLPPYSKVGRVNAIDRDEGDNARVYYYLIEGGNSVFAVDRVDGLISTLTSLDREKRSHYDLFVKATNDPDYYVSKDKNSIEEIKQSNNVAHVKVFVLDENDNAPVFLKKEYNAGVKMSAQADEFVVQVEATDADFGVNGSLSYEILTSHLYKAGSNVSSGSVVPSPFSISDTGRVTTSNLIAEYNQDRFRLEISAKEKAPPYRDTQTFINVWVYEQQQLIRVILSRPPEEVHREKEEIIVELSNATKSLVVIDDIKYHIDSHGHIQHDWCDMYLHVVDKKTLTISTIPDVLKVIDSQYDFLKDYYAGFAIENVLPAYSGVKEETFEPALAALIALLIVLFVGCISVVIVCCCFRHWVVSEPVDLKQSDMLIKKTIIDDLTTTENPLWIEQKLKLYEEQELTMQVFCEPENSQGLAGGMDRRDSMDLSVADNTYATIQHPNRRSSLNTMLSLGGGEYATLGGSVLPLDNVSSHSQQMFEAALGFQGSTFQVPENTDLFKARSDLRINKDGQPEFVSELI